MANFTVPTREQVSPKNQEIFDGLKSKLGFVPNLYAYFAKSDTALADYTGFSGRASSLKAKEKEVINLIVSEYNNCTYCLSAHTAIAKMNGFNEGQILEIRGGSAKFDDRLQTLAQFTQDVIQNRAKLTEAQKTAFLNGGFTEENIIDVVIAITTKEASNYIHNIADFAIDFPLAPALEDATAAV